jgi:hypothetical protein
MRIPLPTPSRRAPRLVASLAALLLIGSPALAQSWSGYARDAQHSADSTAASQAPGQIRWFTPVDLLPQYNNTELLIHYGSPLVTRLNTVLVTVKTGQFDGFRVDAHQGSTGNLIWSLTTDYSVPPHGWTPSCGPTLTPRDQKLMIPAGGGTVLARTYPDLATGLATRLAFYGITNYNSNPSAFAAAVKISSPITSDASGNIYFSYISSGAALPGYPNGIPSGLARISTTGVGTFVSASAAANDNAIQKCVYNCAPALTPAGDAVYVAVNDRAPGDSSFGRGYLLKLSTATLATQGKVLLKDVKTPSNTASISDDGTASPTVGPDGDVYYGVLENPAFSNHLRGWMLHFSGDLTSTKPAGAFGWDDTSAIVPATLLKNYTGTSSYLILTKYNNYVEGGGDGVNKLAILDPNATQTDPVSGATVMKEFITVKGVTPDQSKNLQQFPNAVREWCINTAAIDSVNKSAIVNSEDGHLYRWDLYNNVLTSVLPLNGPVGEAYTPTVIGPDGAAYAVNNATLYSCVAAPPLRPTRTIGPGAGGSRRPSSGAWRPGSGAWSPRGLMLQDRPFSLERDR